VSGAAVSAPRVLILSWEYPPIVEGGLARHVRKLSEQLVRDGVDVHVLTRGGGHLDARRGWSSGSAACASWSPGPGRPRRS
jgi:glycogen synthase